MSTLIDNLIIFNEKQVIGGRLLIARRACRCQKLMELISKSIRFVNVERTRAYISLLKSTSDNVNIIETTHHFH